MNHSKILFSSIHRAKLNWGQQAENWSVTMTIKERTKKLKTEIPAVFIAMQKKEISFGIKLLAGIIVAYALSPIDLIPDFIPVLGLLDDVILLPVLVTLVVQLMPEDVYAQCCKEAEGLWADGKPKRRYFAIPIVLLWILIINMGIKRIV